MLKLMPALLALLAVPAAAQPLTMAERAEIDRLVIKTLADSGVPSASIAIVRDGQIVLTKAWGKANEALPASPAADRITIRQLLSHTSGLQDFWPQDYMFADMLKPTAPQGIVDKWARKPLDYEPGARYQYSNTGYVVAGMIVEKVSGEPLLNFLNRRIFAPLGMHPIDQDETNTPALPAGYHRYALGPVRVA